MPYSCPDCRRRGRSPAALVCPGVCEACDRDRMREEIEQRLAKAIGSIHPERRWAHLDSDLLPERLNPLWWRLSVGGEVQESGHGAETLLMLSTRLRELPRIVITGAET